MRIAVARGRVPGRAARVRDDGVDADGRRHEPGPERRRARHRRRHRCAGRDGQRDRHRRERHRRHRFADRRPLVVREDETGKDQRERDRHHHRESRDRRHQHERDGAERGAHRRKRGEPAHGIVLPFPPRARAPLTEQDQQRLVREKRAHRRGGERPRGDARPPDRHRRNQGKQQLTVRPMLFRKQRYPTFASTVICIVPR